MASETSPVEACTGWSSECSFCNRRFGTWLEVDEDSEETVPNGPAAYMLAFENKQGKEVVIIGVNTKNDKPNTITKDLGILRQRISNKKFKETKSKILLRSMMMKEPDGKEACTIYAHWFNYSILPRLATEWPGILILENNSQFHFSDINRKWCYSAKIPVWRKPKTNVLPKGVSKCKGWIDDCSFCDRMMTPWIPAKSIAKHTAPDSGGIAQYAINDGGKHEVIFIRRGTKPNLLKSQVFRDSGDITRFIHTPKSYCDCVKPEDATKTVDVRWIEDGNENGNEDKKLPFLLTLAHWVNCGTAPRLNACCYKYGEPFDDNALVESEKFVLRERDQQWCFIGDDATTMQFKLKQTKYNRRRERQNMQEVVDDELFEQ